ncbi:MAG: hypothetical protein GY830_01040 [Bacteroidetes bacterium]|nr:hypothetical protein [Bacteroidota bacterium]
MRKMNSLIKILLSLLITISAFKNIHAKNEQINKKDNMTSSNINDLFTFKDQDININDQQSNQSYKSPLNKKSKWQGWYFSTDIGFHFASFPDVKWDEVNINTNYGDKSYGKFWGQLGLMGSPYGFTYTRVFAKNWFWNIKSIWTIFYPDSRWTEKGKQDITLSFIPIIGQYMKAGKLNPALTMFLIPMVYFDIGYITDQNISFSIGSVYLWGLSPTVRFPLFKKLSMEIRTTIFLDRVINGLGFHNLLFSFGLNYKF